MVSGMKTMPVRASRIFVTVAAAGVVATTGVTGAVAASASSRAAALPCSASMSNSHPKDYTTTDVRVHTAAYAHVTTVAHYRTTSTKHRAAAGPRGNATIAYRISDATPGYKVKVSVTVTKGSRTGRCSTSFTPHR